MQKKLSFHYLRLFHLNLFQRTSSFVRDLHKPIFTIKRSSHPTFPSKIDLILFLSYPLFSIGFILPYYFFAKIIYPGIQSMFCDITGVNKLTLQTLIDRHAQAH